MPLQALVQNDGEDTEHLAQGTPVHVFLAPDALRVLGGAAREVPVAPEDDSLVSSLSGWPAWLRGQPLRPTPPHSADGVADSAAEARHSLTRTTPGGTSASRRRTGSPGRDCGRSA